MKTPARGSTAFRLDDALMPESRTPVLAVQGELDLFTSPDLRARLRELVDAGTGDLVVDLSRSTFLDSSGCQALIGAGRRLQARKRRLVIVNSDPAIGRMFEIMGIDELFEVVSTRAQAAGLSA